MSRTPLVTRHRNRLKTSPSRPVTGTVPIIATVEGVTGQSNQLEITFDQSVIIIGMPMWPASVAGVPIDPVSVVSVSQTSIVLDYGEAVESATHIEVPATDQSTHSYSGQRLRTGQYQLS